MTFDSRDNRGPGSTPNGPADVPSKCPACKSAAITTTAKSPADVNAYWRCEHCGEVWNVSRRDVRPSGMHRWR